MDDKNNNINPPPEMSPPDGEQAEDVDIGVNSEESPDAIAESGDAVPESPPQEEPEAAAEGGEIGDLSEASDEEKEMAKMLNETGDDAGDDAGEASSGDESEMLSQASIDAALQGLATDGAEKGPADAGDDQMVRQADFQQLSMGQTDEPAPNIDLLMDVELPVSIELGRTRMNVADILVLGPGSVVELDKLVGEPVDLLVNQKIVARGEVVVVDENFGLRITQLVSPEERVKNLQ